MTRLERILPRRTLAAVLACLAAVAVSLPAGAASPPYSSTQSHTIEYGDAAGYGTTSASSLAKVDGTLSAAAEAIESAPAGLAVPGTALRVGMVEAYAQARVLHAVEISSAGTYAVTIQVDNIAASASAALPNGYSAVTNATSYAALAAQMSIETCAGISCTVVAQAQPEPTYVAYSGPTQRVVRSVTIRAQLTLSGSRPGLLRIDVGFYTGAVAQGRGQATVQADGMVTSMTVTKIS